MGIKAKFCWRFQENRDARKLEMGENASGMQSQLGSKARWTETSKTIGMGLLQPLGAHMPEAGSWMPDTEC